MEKQLGCATFVWDIHGESSSTMTATSNSRALKGETEPQVGGRFSLGKTAIIDSVTGVLKEKNVSLNAIPFGSKEQMESLTLWFSRVK